MIFTGESLSGTSPCETKTKTISTTTLHEVGLTPVWGNPAAPKSPQTRITDYLVPCIATTSYRLPASFVTNLATNKRAWGRYEVKERGGDRFG